MMKKITIVSLIVLMVAAFANAQRVNVTEVNGKSFAGLSINMKMADVPNTIPGLYVAKEKEACDYLDDNGWCWNCGFERSAGDTKWVDAVLVVCDDNGDGQVDRIQIMKRGVTIAGTPVTIGMPWAKFRALRGVTRTTDEYGNDIYKYQGYVIDRGTDEQDNLFVYTIEIR